MAIYLNFNNTILKVPISSSQNNLALVILELHVECL